MTPGRRRRLGIVMAGLAATLAAAPLGASVRHEPGPASALYRAYLEHALGEDPDALGRAVSLAGETSFLALEQALEAGRRGDQRRMIEHAEHAVRLDQDNRDARELLARAYFRLIDAGVRSDPEFLDAAVGHAAAAVRLGTGDHALHDRLATEHGRAARAAAAAGDWESARARRREQLAVLEEWGRRLRSQVAWQRLAEAARETGDLELEIRALRGELARASESERLVVVQALGGLLDRAGRCEEVVALLGGVAGSEDLDVYSAISVNFDLGTCAARLGLGELAKDALRRVLAHDPTNAMAAQALATLLWREGSRAEADAAFDELAERMAGGASYLRARAEWAAATGRLQQAVRHAAEAVAAAASGGISDEDVAGLHVLHAELLLDAGDHAAAAEAAAQALAAEPASDDAALVRAAALWEAGRTSAAQDELEAHARRSDSGPLFLERRGSWEVARGLREAAVRHAEEGLASALESGRLPPRLLAALAREAARILIDAGRAARAEALLREAIARDPDPPESTWLLADAIARQGRTAEAASLLEELLGRPPDPYALERLAAWDARHGLEEDAVRHAGEALAAAQRQRAGPLLRARFEAALGEALLAARRPGEAAQRLAAAFEVVPGQPRIRRLRLAEALERTGQLDAALRALDQGLALDPDDPFLRIERGRILVRLGRAREGMDLIRQTLRGQPESLRHRHAASRLADAGAHVEAREIADALLVLWPGDVAGWLLSGALRERHGEIAAAEADFRKALELAPDDAQALNALGYLLADHGLRIEESVRLLRRAVESHPDEASYLDSLGWALFRAGRVEEAARHLDAAVARARDPVILVHAGAVREKQGRAAEALALYREALERGLDEDVASVEQRVAELAARLEPAP